MSGADDRTRLHCTKRPRPRHLHDSGHLRPTVERDRVLNAVSACSLIVLAGSRYAGHERDFEQTFRVLRSLPADVWMTSHGTLWGRYRKFVQRVGVVDPVAPFIDRDGYRAYIDSGKARFRRGVVQ